MRVLILLLSVIVLVASKPQPKPEPKPQFASDPFNYPQIYPNQPIWDTSSYQSPCYPSCTGYGGGYLQSGYYPQQSIYSGQQPWIGYQPPGYPGGQQIMSKKSIKDYIKQLEKTLKAMDKEDDSAETAEIIPKTSGK